MKKQILLLLLSLASLTGFAQTYDTKPVDALPYGSQLYKRANNDILAGLGSAKFRTLDTKQRVDSIIAVMAANINTREILSNKVQDLSSPNTLTYPSTKAVTDYVSGVAATKISTTEKGAINGVATLDANKQVPIEQLNNKLYQDYSSYSVFRNLGFKQPNSAIILVGDSNSEGYTDNTVGVTDNHYFNILAHELQKIQGPKSGIGFTNFSDQSRYGIALSGTTEILPFGPTKTGLFMHPGSTITFQASTDFVELWYWSDLSSGSLEFRRNGVLYRTLSTAGPHKEGTPSFTQDATYKTSSSDLATYEIRCTGGNVFITALFKQIYLASGFDTFYFLRAGVSAKTFQNFDLSQLRRTTALFNEETLYLLALGTNSIYNATVATSSDQYVTDLGSYIDSLNVTNRKVVYIMPPKATGTTFPPVLEPYENYYTKALALCKARGVPVIDLNLITYSIYGTDGLHYSLDGHKRIATYIAYQLSKIDIGTRDISITGTAANATTATTLATSRLINGVPFNGSSDITVADATKLPLTGGTVTGNIVSPIATAPNQLATLAQAGYSQVSSASGTGSLTQIVINHAIPNVSPTTSVIMVQARNAASANIQYVSIDATKIYINYSVAPVAGTSNLLYSIYIKP